MRLHVGYWLLVAVLFLSLFSLLANCESDGVLCRCGLKGIVFKAPRTSVESKEVCQKYRFCGSCKNGLPKCSSCPIGRSGPFCKKGIYSNVSSVPNINPAARSRRVRGVNCPDIPPPKLGSINCRFSSREKTCTGRCFPDHFFPNHDSEQIVLECGNNGRWHPMSSFPNCKSAGNCDLEMQGAGSYNCTIRSEGTTCRVQCHNPRVNGNYFCYPGREWEPRLPHCIRRKGSFQPMPNERKRFCSDPGFIRNGERWNMDGTLSTREKSFELEETAAFSCLDGYSLQGISVIICEPSGRWSNRLPECKRMFPSGTSTTKADGYPTYPLPPPPTQQPRAICPNPGTIDNGRRNGVTRNFYNEGDTVVYSCNFGYRMLGHNTVTCLSTGTWSPSVPICRRESTTSSTTTAKPEYRTTVCPDPGFVINGERWTTDGEPSGMGQKFVEGISVVFSCNDGFALGGSSLLTCLPSGRWSKRLPQCKSMTPITTTTTTAKPRERKRICPDPGFIRNGQRWNMEGMASLHQRFEQGKSVVFSCSEGYALHGISLMTCRPSGQWSHRLPQCKPAFYTTSSTTTTTTTTEPPDSAVYCDDPGVDPNGQRDERHWLDEKKLGLSRYGSQMFPVGAYLDYSCNEGYNLEGATSIRCQFDGLWSNYKPVCNPEERLAETPDSTVYCDDPGVDPNGRRTESLSLDERKRGSSRNGNQMFPVGTVLEYSCKERYVLEGSTSLRCQFDGLWSNFKPVCKPERRSEEEKESNSNVKYCLDPGYIPDGRREVIYDINSRRGSNSEDEDEFAEGTQLEFTCLEDLELSGSSVITCTASGKWSAPLPECNKGCGYSPVMESRRITSGNKTTIGQWPWQVAIASPRRGIFCGGVLINQHSILTAAHCADGERSPNINLYFGKYHLEVSRDDNKVQVRKASSIIMHQRFNQETYDFDIAVIKFSPSVKLTDRVGPVCLPTGVTTRQNMVRGKKGWVTGWGLTENKTQPEAMLMAHIPVVTKQQCMEVYRAQRLEFPVTDNMYCAGYDEGRIDSCHGDSGGPMTFFDPQTNKFFLEGLVSFGVKGGCGVPKRYTVYTKVGNLMGWVRKNA